LHSFTSALKISLKHTNMKTYFVRHVFFWLKIGNVRNVKFSCQRLLFAKPTMALHLDEWIEKVKGCKYLEEKELKGISRNSK
jgi:hypothetical protein